MSVRINMNPLNFYYETERFEPVPDPYTMDRPRVFSHDMDPGRLGININIRRQRVPIMGIEIVPRDFRHTSGSHVHYEIQVQSFPGRNLREEYIIRLLINYNAENSALYENDENWSPQNLQSIQEHMTAKVPELASQYGSVSLEALGRTLYNYLVDNFTARYSVNVGPHGYTRSIEVARSEKEDSLKVKATERMKKALLGMLNIQISGDITGTELTLEVELVDKSQQRVIVGSGDTIDLLD